MQARNGELSAERDQLKVADDSQKFTILGLHQQLQAASQSVASTVKRLEKGFAEERSRMQAVSVLQAACSFRQDQGSRGQIRLSIEGVTKWQRGQESLFCDAEEERGELEGKVSRLTAEVHDLIRQRTELQ
eukprot:1161140-Pelagomonas_calceolata.AAC.1